MRLCSVALIELMRRLDQRCVRFFLRCQRLQKTVPVCIVQCNPVMLFQNGLRFSDKRGTGKIRCRNAQRFSSLLNNLFDIGPDTQVKSVFP